MLHNTEFPRTHHIELLISLIKKAGILWPDDLDESAGMTIYAVQARYPGFGLQISESQFETAQILTQKVFQWAARFFPE